jgi:hypothetical protein
LTDTTFDVTYLEPLSAVEVIRQAATTANPIAELAARATKYAGWYSDAKTAFDVGTKLLEVLGILESSNEQAELESLHGQLLALGLRFNKTFQSSRLSSVLGAVLTMKQAKEKGEPYTFTSPGYQSSRDAVIFAERPDQWRREYDPKRPAIGGPIQARPDRPDRKDGSVYDWRLAAPHLMQLIGLRLQLIAAADPDFRHSQTLIEELNLMRDALLSNEQLMRDAVECGAQILKNLPATGVDSYDYYYLDVACMDIYTGIARRDSRDADGLTPAGLDALKDSFRRSILAEMPLFEMRAIIDDLYAYSHPGDLDLTVSPPFDKGPVKLNGYIQVSGQEDCLDVEQGSSSVWLQDCRNAPTRQWRYDRQNSTVYHVASGKCLSVGTPALVSLMRSNARPMDELRKAGVPVGIDDCDGSLRQQWTYDMASGIVQNGMGTVLQSGGGAGAGAACQVGLGAHLVTADRD